MTTLDDVLHGRAPERCTIICPFHDDHGPSGHVFPDGHFKCFSCGTWAGSSVDLLRRMEFPDLPFAEGMALASNIISSYGVKPNERTAAPRPAGASEEAVLAMTVYTQYAKHQLANDPYAIQKLKETRGLQEPQKYMGITGLSLVSKTRDYLESGGYNRETVRAGMLEAGLIWPDGNDRLQTRWIIPEVRNGRVIFYQARAIRQAKQKYMNPPIPKPVFGLESLQNPSDYIVIGEGTFDILPFIEDGNAALAILGSDIAYLEDLIDILDTRRIVVCFDSDAVGLLKGKTLTNVLNDMGFMAYHIPPPSPYNDYSEWITEKNIHVVKQYIYWNL